MQLKSLSFGSVIWVLSTLVTLAQAPLAEKYLIEGKLSDGVRALEARLAAAPKDDQARFGLGVTQFLRAFEGFGANLYRYGLRTDPTLTALDRAGVDSPLLHDLLRQNPKSEKITYEAARGIFQNFVDDLARAEKTLSEIQDDAVKLPLSLGRIKIDPFGQGKPIHAGLLLRIDPNVDPARIELVESFQVNFDRGDVCWLRGYCHLLMAWTEGLLAIEGREIFNCSAHLYFERVETPYPFLLEDREALDASPFSAPNTFLDGIAMLYLSIQVKFSEPKRLQATHGHLKQAVAMSREMWTHFNKETDDDHELIPNPKQTGAAGVPVSKEIQEAWLETLAEFEKILDGKSLIPFWRPVRLLAVPKQGINVRRVFFESKEFDLILWIQGTAAAPFLEEGEMTSFSNPEISWTAPCSIYFRDVSGLSMKSY